MNFVKLFLLNSNDKCNLFIHFEYIFLHILNYHSFDKEGERRKFKRANVPEHRARSIDYSDSFGFHKACV